MATFDSLLVSKKNKQRGIYAGKEQSVTGQMVVKDGASYALADILRMIPVGENTRPVALRLYARTLRGNPTITNGTFDIGVAPMQTTNFVRANGDVFPPLTEDTDAFGAAQALGTDEHVAILDLPAPVADSVANYGPYYITLKPAGAGAFSVAGGDVVLRLEVVFLGEESTSDALYTQYLNDKVSN